MGAFGIWVKKYIAIDIAATPDRLGNVLIQLPVTSVAVTFPGTQDNMIGIDVEWRQGVTPRRISGSVTLTFDGGIVGHGQQELKEGFNPIVEDATNKLFQGLVWDEEKNILLAAKSPTHLINGNIPFRPNGKWTERRISDSEIQELVAEKHFLQYGGKNRHRHEEHQRALEDIKELINTYGKDAVYLWDPYLSGRDLVATLFECQHAESDLRAITSGQEPPKCKKCDLLNRRQLVSGQNSEKCCKNRVFSWIFRTLKAAGLIKDDTASKSAPKKAYAQEAASKNKIWIQEQQDHINRSIVDPAKIKLEYRICVGLSGWPFHDRFLIFPTGNNGYPEAWALGASINCIGKSHTVIQKVTYAQPILDAFNELWDRINSNENLVWKSERS